MLLTLDINTLFYSYKVTFSALSMDVGVQRRFELNTKVNDSGLPLRFWLEAIVKHIHVRQSASVDVFIPYKKLKNVQILTRKYSMRPYR